MNKAESKLRGVNLGGWLVLEKWMTPSLFIGSDAEDEYTFCLDENNLEKLEKHRREFITETDFKWMSENGINAVRIPIGYWIFEDDEPFVGALGHLNWAIDMAYKYNLKVLLVLHAAPGSQNGNLHSGRIGKAEWYKKAEYRQKTIDVLVRLADYYYDTDVVWGIELLNEPKIGLFQFKLRRFYKIAYDKVARAARPNLQIIFHDAFTPRLMSGAIWPYLQWPLVMDIHWYHFTFWLHKWTPINWYFRLVKWRGNTAEALSKKQPIIIGEWSGVISGEKLSKFPEAKRQELQNRHINLQLKAYKNLEGWFYWSYKTEGRGIWNFRSLVEDGILKIKE